MIFGFVKKNIMVLSASNLIIGLIEFVFNMYLSRIFGAEGLGLLSLITPINCIFLSFMTEGIVITISKTAPKFVASGDSTANAALIKTATAASFLWALFLVLIVFLTAPYIASHILNNDSLVYPILATCPLMLLMSVSNILKGYFLGISKIRIPALINIGEKLLRFPVLYFLIGAFLNRYNIPPVTLVFLCYAIAEIQSVVLLLIYYEKKYSKKLPWSKVGPYVKQILSPLVKGAVPICLTQCLFELVNALSSIVVKLRLMNAGFTEPESFALLGKYSGMVFPLIMYPMIIVGAACSIIVPKVSTMLYLQKIKAAKRLIKRCIFFAAVTGLITFFITLPLADTMGLFFYKQNGLGAMIRMGGFCAPAVYVSGTTSSLLISIGKETLSFRNSFLQQLILLTGLWIFTGIPQVNIYGYFISIIISNTFLILVNMYCLKKQSPELS